VKRYSYWLADLVNEQKCYIAQDDQANIIGFFAFDSQAGQGSLILAGISPEYHGFGLFFFYSMVDYLKTKVDYVSAMISAANTDVINIYAALGFTFRKPLIGFHKRY
jgi:ribosomal protein S18 acetylase RimI-like enzyme